MNALKFATRPFFCPPPQHGFPYEPRGFTSSDTRLPYWLQTLVAHKLALLALCMGVRVGALLALVGIALTLRRWREVSLLWLVQLNMTVMYIIFHPSTRYRAPPTRCCSCFPLIPGLALAARSAVDIITNHI